MANKDDKAEAEEKKKEALQEDAPERGGDEESAAEGEEGLDPPKSKLTKKKKIIIAAGAAVFLLLGSGAGLFFSGALGGHSTESGTEAGQEEGQADPDEAKESKEEKPKASVFFQLGDVLVNLAGDGKRPNFLKIKVSLELSSEKDKTAIEAMMPRIVDNFQIYLRELRVEDLRGSAGLQRLREELLLRVTEVAAPVHVRDILFQEILVQ